MAKKLKELFNRYTPDEQYVDIMEFGVVENVRVNRELKLVEAEARFEKLVDKKKLYGLEDAIKKAYVLNGVRLIPKYSQELFSESYMSEVLLEAGHRGVISRGFFNEYTLVTEANKIGINISFTNL